MSGLDSRRVRSVLHDRRKKLGRAFTSITTVANSGHCLGLTRRFSRRAILRPLLERRSGLANVRTGARVPGIVNFGHVTSLRNGQS